MSLHLPTARRALAATTDFALASACFLQLAGLGGEQAWAALVLVGCDELGARLRSLLYSGSPGGDAAAGGPPVPYVRAICRLASAAFLFWGAAIFTLIGFLALLLVTPPTAAWAGVVIGKSLWWGWAHRPRHPEELEEVARWARRDRWLRWATVGVMALAIWGGGKVTGLSGAALEHLMMWIGPSGYFLLQGLGVLFCGPPGDPRQAGK